MSRNKSKLLPLGSGHAGPRLAWIGGLLAATSLASGCGKSEPTPAGPAEPAAEAAAAAEAPKPPDVGMDLEAFVAARTLEGCAARYGEPAAEARLLAVRQLAGLPHVAPMTGAALEPIAARRGVPLPEAATSVAPSERGRPGLSPEQRTLQATYEAAITKAGAWPELGRRVDDAVATCHYSPSIGLVSPERIEAYVQAFVEVSCLGDTALDANGKPDVIAHARAAAEVFRKIGLDARGFSQLGVQLGVFPDITARIAMARAKACPDPRAAALHEASSGTFDGAFSGNLQGTLVIEASEGEAKATATFVVGKGKAKATRTMQLSGVLHGGRAHLQGGAEQDALRFDAEPGSNGKGTWSGQIGFRDVRGLWSWQRRVEAGAEAASGAAGAAAAAPEAAPAMIDPAAATAGFPAKDAPPPDPLAAGAARPAAPAAAPVVDEVPKPSSAAGTPATVKGVRPDDKPGKPVAVPGR